MGFDLADWQHEVFDQILYNTKVILNWGRGMSKTLMLCLISVFFALIGMKVCYCVPRTDELTQPMEYFNNNPFVDRNPHKRTADKSYNIQKANWFYVLGKPMIKITNIDDKGFNLSSGRFSVVIYDECALLMYYQKEVELLNKGKGMLRSQNYPHIIYASTPLIGSHFYSMFENYPDRCKSWKNYENTPNNFITDRPEKLAQLLEEREEARQMGVEFAWETENLAIPRTASGAAFKNIIEAPISTFRSQIPTHCGFDFHGWQLGHIWVAFYYNPSQDPESIYILKEGAERYDESMTADESMQFLGHDPFFRQLTLKGESGGMINDPYIKAGRQWGLQGVNINGQDKHNLEANILNFHIYVDPRITPNVYRDLTEAEWKDANKLILHKEATGMKFRNHYIDAMMNVLPLHTRAGIFVPNRRLRETNSILEQERRRDAEAKRVFF